MPATVIINRLTGSGPTLNNITGINTRANAEDAHSTSGTANPIQIPASGTNYSYWVVTRLQCTVAPSTLINNLKWFTDGGNGFGTGVTCKVQTASGYVQATGTPGESGTQLTTGNYASLAGAPSDAFAYTSASPLSVSGSIGATTGEFGDRVVYQIEVASTASPGVTPSETFTWRYDEI
jgi:hypothetical protein